MGDFLKICQNWTSRRGESDLAKFSKIPSTINPKLYEQHGMTICLLLARQNYIHIKIVCTKYAEEKMIQKVAKCGCNTFHQYFVLLFAFSLFAFAFNASSSTKFVCKYLNSAILFVLGKSLIILPYN